MSSVEISISRTKTIIPALRPDILRRARLLMRFDDLLDKKLIIITAPAGYGKTSLLLDLAHHSEMPVCWLSLDALDKDPQRFITYLIAALAERFPNFGKRSISVLKTITTFEQDSERLLTSLINELDDLIGEHFTLILDDYHLIDSIPSIRDLFSRFVYLVGENCHVILASRRLPALPDIALMVARQQVGGFDLEELAFRTEEIRSLFEQNYGLILTGETAEQLVRQTEGWITGLHLSAIEVVRAAPHPATTRFDESRKHTARVTGVDLAVYLDQQVLSLQPPRLRQFLLQTSLLEEFDAKLCDAVLGEGDWRNMLEMVRRNSLFVLPVGSQGKSLRYHHLFKDFLQERIRHESPEMVSAILSRLALVYEERREWEKAHAILHQLGNLDALADLVERVGTFVSLSEHYITLQSWLDEFPAALLEKRPRLLSLKGVVLCSMVDGRAALPLFDRAIALFQNQDDLPNLAQTLVRRAAARRLVGDYAGAVEDASQALHISETIPNLEPVSAEAQRFKGICLFRLGQVEQAVSSQEDSLRRYELLGEVKSIARLQMELGWVCQSTGKHEAAAGYYQKALAEWKREDNLFSQASALNNLAVLDYMQGDYVSAVETLEKGLVCARQGGFRWQEAMQLASLGDILSDLDEFVPASQTYAKASALAQQVSYQFLVNYLLLAQARLARLQNRFQEAHRLLQEVRPLVQAGGSNYEWGLYHMESGCLSLAESKLQPALSDLQNALDQFQHGSLTAEAEWTRAWLVAAFARSGDESMARSHLQKILAVLSHETGDLPLVHTLRHAAPWLVDLQAHPETNALQRRITQAGQHLPILRKRLRRIQKTASLQASRLTIQTLGKPQVRVNGKLVTLSQWQTRSARDLFFYFLLNTRAVTKDEVGETFWPEIEPAQLKLRFKNNLYRVRHVLGAEVIQFENNQYFFNHQQDYEYDVEEFDSHLIQARIAGQVEDKIAQILAAIKLWHGFYLQGLDATWVWPERQRLELDFLDALRQLVELQRQSGDPQSALQTCQRALEVNSCLEDFHCLAMQLNAERGDRLAVIWQYQACREALQKELDMLPSEETRELYQRLIS
jgi:LuxR family maltose regulon positive regulatory protein